MITLIEIVSIGSSSNYITKLHLINVYLYNRNYVNYLGLQNKIKGFTFYYCDVALVTAFP